LLELREVGLNEKNTSPLLAEALAIFYSVEFKLHDGRRAWRYRGDIGQKEQ
jgi:hypothetical protein